MVENSGHCIYSIGLKCFLNCLSLFHLVFYTYIYIDIYMYMYIYNVYIYIHVIVSDGHCDILECILLKQSAT